MMYSINKISELTGITAFTLRYYEKIGLLPSPKRRNGKKNGVRQYDDHDLQFIRFIHGLKQTGMKLQEIQTFTEEGCLLIKTDRDTGIRDTLHKRIEMLDQHIKYLEQQMRNLEDVKIIAQEKRNLYSVMLKEPDC
ncbi:MerR family transcriptional regulator [Priestia megaterium]|uniref:MerR family transcriptional regulator n=1 Tax=Priestia megaterium TaxID=1404 RepID=UPI001F10682D|nr:MerR family transcriptional regulator [Priestia megaterium]